MTQDEKDDEDLEFLTSNKVDMSPGAITERMIAMGKLCDLAHKLKLADIRYFQSDTNHQPGRFN